MKEFDFVNPWEENLFNNNQYSNTEAVNSIALESEYAAIPEVNTSEIINTISLPTVESKFINVYWTKDTSGTPVNVVDFNEDIDQAIIYCCIQVQNMKWAEVIVNLYSINTTGGSAVLINGKSVKIYNDDVITSVYVSYSSKELFGGLNDYYYVEVKTGKLGYSSKSSLYAGILQVNPIKSVQYIMQNMGTEYEFPRRMQLQWLNDNNIDTRESKPDIGAFTVDWVLKNSIEDKKRIDEFVANQVWLNTKGIDQLKIRIQEMINNNDVLLPPNKDDTVEVNYLDREFTLVSYGKKGHFLVPKFEAYHYQSRALEVSTFDIAKALTGYINPVFAVLGTYQIKWTPKGYIKKISDKESLYEFTLSDAGMYIQDTFEFIDEDQKLGYWSPIRRDYSLFNAYFIKNMHYLEYQRRTGKGRNFALFSQIKSIPTNFKYEFTI